MKNKVLIFKIILILFINTLIIPAYSNPYGFANEDVVPFPRHSRPYFMPDIKRQEIHALVRNEPWANEEKERIKNMVHEVYSMPGKYASDNKYERVGFWAAFLYALEGGNENLEVAHQWLLKDYGNDARETKQAREALNDPDYWKGNEGSIPYYRLDFDAYAAYDFIYTGLTRDERGFLYEVLSLQTRYRMACMDSWGSTPNLNFKPISMVAFAGMALRDREILEWGWKRDERQGSFYSMMDEMFKDGAVWGEAAIYAIGHSELRCVATLAYYRSLYEQTDWYDHETPTGTSMRKIANYYLDTSYPVEKTGGKTDRIRIVTYGDGATSPPRYAGGEHDLFIGGINPKPTSRLVTQMIAGLSMAYTTLEDPRIAPFLALYDDYQPNLWDRRALPDQLNWPTAPSTVWPEFGIAMLRSDESSGYYTNPDAIAAFQIMTKSYGHDQPDKFHLNLFGAGRLLYPDYLIRQYENRAIGWTYTSSAHNTMIVDELDTKTAEPFIRSEFTPELKFLATSASGVFPMVDQTRTLMLTKEYLLDLFQASSKIPHTYDYVLNSMGLPSPIDPSKYETEGNVSEKYWALDEPRKAVISDKWSMEFIIDEEPPNGAVLGLGKEWFDHVAHVRVTMAAEENTEVCYGTWGDGKYIEKSVKAYASANSPSPHHRRQEVSRMAKVAEPVGMLIARRENVHNTVFAVTHEPYSNAQKPVVSSIEKIVETDDALVVCVRGKDFTDYAAISWGKDGDQKIQVLGSSDREQVFQFRNYAWIRILDDGTSIGHGDWKAFRIAGEANAFKYNNQELKLKNSKGYVVYGKIPRHIPDEKTLAEFPLELTTGSSVPRIDIPGSEPIKLHIRNKLDQTIEGRLGFDTDSFIVVKSESTDFGPLNPGETAEIDIILYVSEDSRSGRRYLPVNAKYKTTGEKTWHETRNEKIPVIMGRSVRQDFTTEFISQVYEGPELTARLESRGMITYLADKDGNVRLKDSPLYTVKDKEGVYHISEKTQVVTGQWWGLRSSIGTHHKIGGFRMNMEFQDDRIADIGFRRTYTRQPSYIFSFPGDWISPEGDPSWKTVIAVDENGNEFEADPGTNAPVAAVELAFPDGGQSIAISFDPPLPVTFDDLGIEFILPRPILNGPSPDWSIGFCDPGKLNEWRKEN